MLVRFFFTYIICCLAVHVNGQVIGNIFAYGNPPEPSYVRLTYDNDFFTATDRYYTQGIQLTIANQTFRHNPLNYLLIKSKSASVHGISFEHNAYTPTSITATNILYGDQPYTAALMLSSFAIHTNRSKKEKWISSLSLGVLGTSASGEWMQRGIHKWLNNVQPEGWKYQLKDAPIINYTIEHQRNLFQVSDHFSVASIASLSAGTLITKTDAGLYFTAGTCNNPYSNSDRKKIRAHLYAHPSVSLVAYNASLQGGMFTRGNIYTIPSVDIRRFIFKGLAGIAFNYAGLSLEHYYGFSTKTFRTQKSILWGGVSIGVHF